jgi:hypothetical protein
MKAVAIMTPEPKYFATKKARLRNFEVPKLRAKTGNTAPNIEPTIITKMDDIRKPMRPSYSFPVSQEGVAPVSGSRTRRV